MRIEKLTTTDRMDIADVTHVKKKIVAQDMSADDVSALTLLAAASDCQLTVRKKWFGLRDGTVLVVKGQSDEMRKFEKGFETFLSTPTSASRLGAMRLFCAK